MINLTRPKPIIRESLDSQLRRFAVPLTIFLVIILLSATFGKGLVDNIFSTRERIEILKSENLTLQDKKGRLSSMDLSLLTRQAQVTLLAVPSEPSALAAMAAVRAQAFERQVTVTEVKASEKEGVQKGVREASLIFEFEGNLGAIMQFVSTLKTTVPLIKVSKIKMLGSGIDVVSADIDLLTFWADLPKSLPAATTPLSTLSKKDEDLIAEMEKLRASAGRGVAPASPAGKTNPFTK